MLKFKVGNMVYVDFNGLKRLCKIIEVNHLFNSYKVSYVVYLSNCDMFGTTKESIIKPTQILEIVKLSKKKRKNV